MQALALSRPTPSSHSITETNPQGPDAYLWLQYFDPDSALQAVVNHVEALPGSRHERHTMRLYLQSLADFCRFQGAQVIKYDRESYDFVFAHMTMPSKPAIAEYIAHGKRSGLSARTLRRHLVPIRHFIRALEEQPVYPQSGSDFVIIMTLQQQFRLAARIADPPADRTSNRPALDQHGTRLTLAQVNTLLESLCNEMHTLRGKRDLALLYLGITSGLRAAEIARLTLDNITPGENCYEVRVRGKRANHDPIGIDADAYALIMAYVLAWNGRLPDDDPRRITGDGLIFRHVRYGDHIPGPDEHGVLGITDRAILKIVERRSQQALDRPITAHDMRRTCAYLMRSNGFEWDEIRSQLRHKSIATTERYVGRDQNLARSLLSTRVQFMLPTDTRQPLPLEVS